mgnify:CR=1 FL=1
MIPPTYHIQVTYKSVKVALNGYARPPATMTYTGGYSMEVGGALYPEKYNSGDTLNKEWHSQPEND